MAAKREVWRETLQHKTGGEWETRVLIAYCGSKDISACICICGTDSTSPSNVEETFKLKGAKINHANFQSPTTTPEKAQIPRNEFQLTTSDSVTLEFRLQNGRNCFDWTKLLTILTEYPNMRVPREPQTPVTFHSKPDPYLYGSDSVWAVYIMHEGVGRRGLVVGVNVVALRNAVRGVSPGILDIIYPQDPTNKIASWEHGKIKTVGRIGKLVFLEISEECKPGGPGHVWMFVGYGEALGLCETIKNFLHQGDGTPVVIQDTQLLPKFEIMHCSFHSDTLNESRPTTTTHTDEDQHPRPVEESDLPSLELQQRSLYDQIRENCHIPEVVAQPTPDIDISLPSSRKTKSPGPQLKRLVLEVRDMCGWFHLGVYLGIPRRTLDQIHAKHVASLHATEKCKIDMLSTWREYSDNCTWSALVAALHHTGRIGLARRIAAKYGVMDSGQFPQPEDSFRRAFMDIVSNSQQAATILSMQKTIGMEDKKLLETEQLLKEQRRYSQTLEQELKKIREELHFSEIYRGMQMSDIQLHQMRKRDNEIQVHTLATTVQNLTELRKERYLTAQRGETLLSPQVESELQQSSELFYRKREESDEISQQISQSYSNQKSAQKEAVELKERIGVLTSQCENVARAFEQLQREKEELTIALKTHEKDMDQKLIGSRQHEQMLEEDNWIKYEDRRAELKLRESEIEQCTEWLEEKEARIRMLTDRLENKSLKLHEMEERVQKLSKEVVGTPSRYASIMELHLAEQMSTTLALEQLQYKIQLLNEEVSKREIQFQTTTLSEGVNEVIAVTEAMRERVVPPTKPSEHAEPILQTRMSYSADELRDFVPELRNPTDLEIEPFPYRNRTAMSPPTSQSSNRFFQPPNISSGPVSQSSRRLYHPPNISSGHASMTRSASAPTSENFALIHSGYKRTLASSIPHDAVDFHLHRHRQYPQETTSYNTSRYSDRRAPPPIPSHHGFNPLLPQHERRVPQYDLPRDHGFNPLLPQHERRVPQYDPPRRGRPGTIV